MHQISHAKKDIHEDNWTRQFCLKHLVENLKNLVSFRTRLGFTYPNYTAPS